MIDLDLERQLAPLVETAPGAPPVAAVHARARARRRRRNIMGTSIGAAAVIVVVAAVVATVGTRHDSAPIIQTPGSTLRASSGSTVPSSPTGAGSAITVTAPNGSRFMITGSKALGLSSRAVRFHAQISSDTVLPLFTAQEITVQDVSVSLWGTCKSGNVYGRWRLVVSCGTTEEVRRILTLLHPQIDADGFLEFHPEPPMIVGPTDAPDVDLALDAGAIGVFDSSTFPVGCPTAADATGRTAHGDLARVDNTGAWWCEAAQQVRIHVAPGALIADALRTLQVERTPG